MTVTDADREYALDLMATVVEARGAAEHAAVREAIAMDRAEQRDQARAPFLALAAHWEDTASMAESTHTAAQLVFAASDVRLVATE